jgi:hypothetical protein
MKYGRPITDDTDDDDDDSDDDRVRLLRK